MWQKIAIALKCQGLPYPSPAGGHLTSVLKTVTCCQILNFESYQNVAMNILGPLKLTCAFVRYNRVSKFQSKNGL